MEHEVGYNSDSGAGGPVSGAAKKRGLLGENRNLWLVLGGLCVMAVVLVVGIVMVNVEGGEVDEAGEVVVDPEMNTLEEYKENFAYSTDEDIKPVLDWYRTQVDAAMTNEEKAEILKDEVYFLMDYDRNNVYGEEALAVARNLEKKDVSSGHIQVMNIALKYNYQDLYNEYYEEYSVNSQGDERENEEDEY